jgi:hypothetical protein
MFPEKVLLIDGGDVKLTTVEVAQVLASTTFNV